MPATAMRIHDASAYRIANELDILSEFIQSNGQRLLELGCGRAWMTRLLAERWAPQILVATEVDQVQHAKNLAIQDLPQVSFRLGGAQAIEAPDQDFDLVFLFKSLHHVPRELMDQALGEIHRVLKPGGLVYVSEPVYWGDFNAILSLFNDEREVREAAFDALVRAVAAGMFDLQAEVFFQVPGTYDSWEAFEQQFLNVTHTEFAMTPELYQRVRAAFLAHLTPGGASFLKPHRADLLRRPG
jgi:ubiquinone/menaquinone biosynthesis C-methylase UbiE